MKTSGRSASQRQRAAGGNTGAKRAVRVRKVLPAPRVGRFTREEASRIIAGVIAARGDSARQQA